MVKSKNLKIKRQKPPIIIIPTSLKKKAFDQLHINNMGIEKIRLLACEAIYWINLNADQKIQLKTAPYALICR